jgi:hypothetical protein
VLESAVRACRHLRFHESSFFVFEFFSPFPYRWFGLANGVWKSLDYPNAFRAFLTDINSAGVIVGSWGNTNGGGGFLYANGKFNDVFGPNGEATAINGIMATGM